MNVIYFCEPQVGGTFTFFLRLRAGLRARGVDVRCVPPVSGERFEGTRFAHIEGVDYLRFPADLAAATRMMVDHLERERTDVVIILPGCDVFTTNLVRYLPARIRNIARVPMMTRGAYRPVMAVAGHLDHVVGVCRRIRDDLVGDYGLPAGQVSVIENGVDVDRFTAPPRIASYSGPLRVLYAGRLEDVQKCVLLLPEMARQLAVAGVGATFTVVGDGPDAARLRGRFSERAPTAAVAFLGAVSHADLPALYASHDVFVLPTRFEGTPNALLEAMAAGCVPVVSRLPGSLDVVVEDGRSGWLCRVGDARDFSSRLAGLARDRSALASFSRAAGERVRTEFNLARMIDRYQALFDSLVQSPSRRLPPLDRGCYAVPRALRSNWRQHVPSGVKKLVRTMLGRLGRSV